MKMENWKYPQQIDATRESFPRARGWCRQGKGTVVSAIQEITKNGRLI